MTCIAGLVADKTVYIGGDSAATSGWGLTILKEPKVFRNKDFLIGCSGAARMITLLRHSLIPPEQEENEDTLFFMATRFIDAVRECLKNGGLAKKENEQETMGESCFLVGYRGQLFCVYDDYHLSEALCAYGAIGCGDDIALGSLYTTHGMDISPDKRVEMALYASEKHNAGVRAPFLIQSI
jgi:hypothetical protein